MAENKQSESQHKVLEAMSFIYEICMKKAEYKISVDTDFYKHMLKTYNDLQLLRDDSIFENVDIDLNDKYIKKKKQVRIDELLAPPFNAVKESWMR